MESIFLAHSYSLDFPPDDQLAFNQTGEKSFPILAGE
jgi:hypothetical protein